MKSIVSLVIVFASMNAMASYSLSKNGKAVHCSGDDNISVVLNSTRSGVKYTVEGESNGAQKVIKVKTDNRSYISYKTSELTLTLSNKGDSVLYDGDQEAQGVDCK